MGSLVLLLNGTMKSGTSVMSFQGPTRIAPLILLSKVSLERFATSGQWIYIDENLAARTAFTLTGDAIGFQDTVLLIQYIIGYNYRIQRYAHNEKK